MVDGWMNNDNHYPIMASLYSRWNRCYCRFTFNGFGCIVYYIHMEL